MILDCPNCFGFVQIILVGSWSFWLSPDRFGQVQLGFFWTNFYDLDLSKIIWIWQNNLGIFHLWNKIISEVEIGNIDGPTGLPLLLASDDFTLLIGMKSKKEF